MVCGYHFPIQTRHATKLVNSVHRHQLNTGLLRHYQYFCQYELFLFFHNRMGPPRLSSANIQIITSTRQICYTNMQIIPSARHFRKNFQFFCLFRKKYTKLNHVDFLYKISIGYICKPVYFIKSQSMLSAGGPEVPRVISNPVVRLV